MTELPFHLITEAGPYSSDWRCIMQFGPGFESKLNWSQALEVARHIRDVIERNAQHEPVRNHEGHKFSVRRFENMIAVDVSFPTPTTDTKGLRLAVHQAKDLIHELVTFAEQAVRAE